MQCAPPPMLEAHLRDMLPGLHGRMRIEPLAGSASSFRIGFTDRTLLLRTEPAADKLLPLAPGLRREVRILKALAASGLPVPSVLLAGDDLPFYVAELPEGRVFSSYALPELPPARRRAVFFAMAETMARLHRVDWAAAGLADYARPARFFEREVAHWTRQHAEHRELARVGDWLAAHVPVDDESAIHHGDFRLGNLVFDATGTRVLALCGWENATLGHPLADAARSCLPWQLAYTGIGHLDLARQGIPTQAEYLTHYRQCGGHAEPMTTFHLVFALFRAAATGSGGLARRAAELIDGA